MAESDSSISLQIDALRREIADKVAEYYNLAHRRPPFVPGQTKVNYGGRVYDEQELQFAVQAVLDFWLTDGPWMNAFAASVADFWGLAHVLPVNSGSSANLIAVSALCSQTLPRPLQPGDEVITPAATFPTTVAPIVQNGLTPVFIDCRLGDYNIEPGQLEAALSPRTRALFVPHTLGNPVEMDAVMAFARAHDLYVIEDVCDALGSRYDGRYCGGFGDLATLSFYPAHHITTGEGGAVGVNDPFLHRIAQTLRNWGRDCWCEFGSSSNGACGQRFNWHLDGLDEPYDHRYYFSEIGYNLKMTEMQAAIGLAQVKKLPDFIQARQHNFSVLYEGLKSYEEHLVLPTWSPKAEPAWFAFPITVREEAPFTRRQLTDHLESRRIETRLLFAGNILRQPGYQNIAHRVAVPLVNTDRVLRGAFFVGVYPGMSEGQLHYMLQVFADFFQAQGLG